jgi:hypothetical protein
MSADIPSRVAAATASIPASRRMKGQSYRFFRLPELKSQGVGWWGRKATGLRRMAHRRTHHCCL